MQEAGQGRHFLGCEALEVLVQDFDRDGAEAGAKRLAGFRPDRLPPPTCPGNEFTPRARERLRFARPRGGSARARTHRKARTKPAKPLGCGRAPHPLTDSRKMRKMRTLGECHA
jgi:hypothetical protein